MTSSNVTLRPEESRIVAKVINFLGMGNRANTRSRICKKFANGDICFIVSISEMVIYDVMVTAGLNEFGIRHHNSNDDFYWERISRIA